MMMKDFSNVITSGNLKFGTVSTTSISVKGLPDLYFLDKTGLFVQICPWHEDGFSIVKKKNRIIFFLTDEEYENIPHNTGAVLYKNAPEDSVYKGIRLRTGDNYRVVSYTNPAKAPCKGNYVITRQRVKTIYKNLRIDLDGLIAYCRENTEEKNNAYIKESKEDITNMLQEGFPLKN